MTIKRAFEIINILAYPFLDRLLKTIRAHNTTSEKIRVNPINPRYPRSQVSAKIHPNQTNPWSIVVSDRQTTTMINIREYPH